MFLWWGVRISIHALLAESDWCISRKQPVQAAFLSTLSLRRATVSKRRLPSSCRLFLSTLSLRRATVVHIAEHASPGRFLSTLSLRRATIKWLGYSELGIHFYPRSPCGERPANRKCLDFGWCISIHALLAESDSALAPKQNPTEHFYPRSPCGERPAPLHMCHRVDTFLSTLSLRRATAPPAPQGKSSIFLSTLSLRRATRETVPRGGHIIFLSTLSLRRATGCQRPCARPTRDFYPRSPCGERRELNSN